MMGREIFKDQFWIVNTDFIYGFLTFLPMIPDIQTFFLIDFSLSPIN